MTADEQVTSKGGRTRARIYRAAVAHFRSRGYTAATMRDIAAAAGVSLGLSYRYFASKETIVLELYSEHIGQRVARMA